MVEELHLCLKEPNQGEALILAISGEIKGQQWLGCQLC